jgi:hypothetical protein
MSPNLVKYWNHKKIDTTVRSALMRGIQKYHNMSHLVKNVRARFLRADLAQSVRFTLSPSQTQHKGPVAKIYILAAQGYGLVINHCS